MAEIINRDDKNGLITVKYKPAGLLGYRLTVAHNGAPVKAYEVYNGLAIETGIIDLDWDVIRGMFAPVC